ncbi:MAG: hypothetical protein KA508_05120 [Gammaproteobacteria bacterium]|nr:hypothetical protein [Gammaproteobacteria bacterium]
MNLKQSIEAITVDINKIKDPSLRSIISQLLNIIEEQSKTITLLQEDNQKLRDENNRLKGEKGKPDIRPQLGQRDISSEKEIKK